MNRIDRDNYGMFIIDYQEGNLSPALTEELFAFLENNPRLKEEFIGFEDLRLPPEELPVFHHKNKLKKELLPVKDIDGRNFENRTIAFFENDLSQDEQRDLNEFYKLNPSLKKIRDLYQKTRLTPDASVQYPEKDQLRKAAFIIYRKWVYAAASVAAVILLLMVLWPFQWGNTDNGPLRYVSEDPFRIQPLSHSTNPEELTIASIPVVTSVPVQYSEPVHRTSISKMRPIPKTPEPGIQYKSVASLKSSNDYKLLKQYSKPFQDEDLASPEQNNRRGPVIKKIFASLFKSVKSYLMRKDPIQEKSGTGFWNFADLGVKGFNALTDKEVDLKPATDEDGRVTAWKLSDQDHVLLSVPVNQDK